MSERWKGGCRESVYEKECVGERVSERRKGG